MSRDGERSYFTLEDHVHVRLEISDRIPMTYPDDDGTVHRFLEWQRAEDLLPAHTGIVGPGIFHGWFEAWARPRIEVFIDELVDDRMQDPKFVQLSGPCALVSCLETVPHRHEICPRCGAVRFGNIMCVTCRKRHAIPDPDDELAREVHASVVRILESWDRDDTPDGIADAILEEFGIVR